MNKWNIQSEKDLWNEPVDWSGTYYSVILKNGQEREVRTYADECCDGTINTYWEYTDDDSGVDFDDILLWRPVEKHDYEGMVEKFKAVVDGKTKEELAELFEEPEELVSEDLEEEIKRFFNSSDYHFGNTDLDIARHFADWKENRIMEKLDMFRKELIKASERHSEAACQPNVTSDARILIVVLLTGISVHDQCWRRCSVTGMKNNNSYQ